MENNQSNSSSSWENNNFPPLSGGFSIKRNPNRVQQQEPQHQQQQEQQQQDLPSESEIDQHTQNYNLQGYHPYFESKPTIKILTRKKDTNQTESFQPKPVKSLEEKEKDYQKARALLFKDEKHSSPSSTSPTIVYSPNNSNNNGNSPTNQVGGNSPVNTRNEKIYSPGSLKQKGDSSPPTNNNTNGTTGGASTTTTTTRQPVGPEPNSRGFNQRGRGGKRGGIPK